MRKCVFIHTNERQWIGTLVAQYALRRNSARPDAFNVEIIHVKDHEFLWEKEGQPYLRGGATRTWRMGDLQSFTPLRFLPPRLMGYEGRAIVIDPDVFAVGDILGLFNRDMEGKAVVGRKRSKDPTKFCLATSVMLLDCARLRHWQPEEEFNELFAFKRDYKDWMCLSQESPEHVGFFESEWNDFDHLDKHTKLLHNTKRKTQPWKTGLPVDFTPADKLKRYPGLRQLRRLRDRLFGEHAFRGRYTVHPDPNQERFFFGLLRECLDKGVVEESLLRKEMERNHVRQDALDILDRTPPLPA